MKNKSQLTMALFVVSVVALPLLFAPPAIGQGACTDCDVQVAALYDETAAVDFAEKDKASVLGKVSDAQSKLAKCKCTDAADKIDDYMKKVEDLAAKGKLDSGVAENLLDLADGALTCIQAIPDCP